jgi:hypothetical protein
VRAAIGSVIPRETEDQLIENGFRFDQFWKLNLRSIHLLHERIEPRGFHNYEYLIEIGKHASLLVVMR